VAADLDNMSHLAATHVGPENPSAIYDTVNEIHILHSTKQQSTNTQPAITSNRIKKTYFEGKIVMTKTYIEST
jgi:hypothetical protein